MSKSSNAWLLPLTGAVFVILIVVGFAVGGEGVDPADESAREVVRYYTDNETETWVSVLIVGLGLIFFVYFGAYLRKVLRAAGDPDSILPTVAFTGVIVFVAGMAAGGAILVTLVESVDDISLAASEAINALSWSWWLPMALGVQIFIFASGLSIVRTGALPKWLGWIAILIGVVGVTPVGFAAFLAGGVWVLVVSVLLALRERSDSAGSTPTAAEPPPAT
jgi:hypothetical protein